MDKPKGYGFMVVTVNAVQEYIRIYVYIYIFCTCYYYWLLHFFIIIIVIISNIIKFCQNCVYNVHIIMLMNLKGILGDILDPTK